MRYRTTITSEEDGQVGSFEYVWVDGKLISIVFVSDGSTQTAKYLYNDFDEPIGMVVTSESGTLATYYYLKNAQGDITNIVSAGGAKLIEFTYDVFGNPTVHYQADPSTIIGMMNLAEQVIVRILTPFGYRGYCYDPYSGLYYLQSRYYDPQTGRFINADDTNYLNATGTVLGCNLFAYCENDPVNRVDYSGCKSNNNSAYTFVYMLYFSLLLTTYQEAFIISTDNNKKGKITINLEKNVQGGSLSSLIYSFYKLIGGKVFDIMSVYACDKFKNEYYKIHNEKHKQEDKTGDGSVSRSLPLKNHSIL